MAQTNFRNSFAALEKSETVLRNYAIIIIEAARSPNCRLPSPGAEYGCVRGTHISLGDGPILLRPKKHRDFSVLYYFPKHICLPFILMAGTRNRPTDHICQLNQVVIV